MEFFGTVRQKIFHRKSWYSLPPPTCSPPSHPWTFSKSEISETLRGSFMKIFGLVRQEVFERKSWYSLPLLIHNFFAYRNFFETQHRRVPLWNSSALSDKIFLTENRDTRPPVIHNSFDNRKLSETQHRRVPLRNSSALWDKNFLIENRDTPSLPPSHPWIFSIPEISETLRSSPMKFFGTNRRKLFDGKSWHSSPSCP